MKSTLQTSLTLVSVLRIRAIISDAGHWLKVNRSSVRRSTVGKQLRNISSLRLFQTTLKQVQLMDVMLSSFRYGEHWHAAVRVP